MVIDCQTHVMCDEYIDTYSRNTQSPRMEKDASGKVITIVNDKPVLHTDLAQYDINKKISDMDKFGIDVSILSPNIPGPCMLAPELALKGARAINDYLAEVIHQHPGRFAGIASLPWQNPSEAIAEMDRAADSLGLCAVMLFSHINGQPVDAPQFDPIFANAEAKGLPVVIHPTFPTWGPAIRDYMMIPMIGFQLDSSIALLRLILGGVMERRPGLKLLMPHAGGVLPYMIGRIDYQTEVMGRKPENITQPPSLYLKRVFFDSCSLSAQTLKFACDFSGPDRVLMGTDHPWVDPMISIEIIKELAISDEYKSLILGGNAQGFFDLD
jgi:aminocarboxymuconate-semialdehyde decarboxylase